MKKAGSFRLLVLLWLVAFAASCQDAPPSSPAVDQEPVYLPTPGDWEPGPDLPSTLALSTQDFRSNFDQYGIVTDPSMPRSANRGPSLTLEISGLAPPASLLDKPDVYNEHLQELLELLRAGLSLQRLDGDKASPVEAEIRDGWYDTRGRGPDPQYVLRPAISLVPKNALDEGWYVFRADLSGALQLGVHRPHLVGAQDGNVLHARVYIGSRPMWYRLFVECRALANEPLPLNSTGGRFCVFDLGLTELISPEAFQQGSAAVHVRYDESDVVCAVPQEANPLGELSVRVACPEPQEGTQIEVLLESQQIPDPLGRTATPVEFVFDRETLPNVKDEQDPIFQGVVSPFEEFGLE